MTDTKYILEYRYENETDDNWREEGVFNNATEAHIAFSNHVKEYLHITLRVRKVRYIAEESIIADFNPINSSEHDD